MTHQKLSGQELFAWRKKQLSFGGRSIDLDWLLDLGGGLRWSSLQKLYLDPKRYFVLDKSLEELEKVWLSHIEDSTPLQYLLGCCPWRDFELSVSSKAMIPRQETEILIDLAVQRINKNEFGVWADLGTGCGPIAVALARELIGWKGYAVDCSKDALSLAQINLQRLAPEAKIKLLLGNWWEPLRPWWGSFNLVVANPPYIPSGLLNELDPEVRLHEPHLALFGGIDGLQSIKEIISYSFKALAPFGWLIMEHHHDQSALVLEMMKQVGLKNVHFEEDLQGVKRFALASKSCDFVA